MSMDALFTRLEAVTARLEKLETGGSSPAAAPAGQSVAAWDETVLPLVAPMIAACDALGGLCAKGGAALGEAFAAERGLLVVAATSAEPAPADLPAVASGLTAASKALGDVRFESKGSDFESHGAAMSEAAQVLGWVFQKPKPVPFAKEMVGATKFHSNRVLMKYRGKEEKHVAWAKALNALLDCIPDYVKQHHTTGLEWKKGGKAAAAPAAQAAAAPKTAPKKAVKKPAGGLFAELNAKSDGSSAAKGLNTVTSAMKTKNQTGKTSKVVAKKVASKGRPKGEPKFEQDGSKWIVENQEGNKAIVIDGGSIKDTVYVYKCDNCTIQVKNKVNAITLDDCRRTAIVYEGLLSSFDVINCQSIQMQVLKSVNSINIDKSSGMQMYMSNDSLDADIVFSQSTEMNVVLPAVSDDVDPVECAIVDQYLTKVVGGKLVTTPVTHV